MKKNFVKLIIVSAVICLINFNCKQNKSVAPETGFPPAVNDIIVTKCSINGCHNAASAPGAAYLDLTSWTSLFKGATGGAIVIPYRPDQSWLCFFTNTNSAIGPALQPAMPYNQAPLSTTDYQTLVNWINAGAPDINGNIAFCCDPNRAKIYCTNQGCNLVTVFDANTQLAMRYINVGDNAAGDIDPHQVRISPDGQYWYVVFLGGNIIQKFSAVTDDLVGTITINPVNQSADWTSICIMPDGNHAFAASWVSDGELVYLDLNNLTVLKQFPGLIYPHAIHYYRNNLYVTSQYGNVIYKYNIDSLVNTRFGTKPKEIVMAPGEYPRYTMELDPHELAFTPDSTEYLVTCENSNEVRVFKTANDSLLAVIPVGVFPQEIVASTTTPYAYVTCTNDPSTYPLTDGSVCIINYKTNTFVKKLQDGLWQPHGIALDEPHKLAYVLSENYSGNGPAPHHPSGCGGNNGYVMLIDMNTLSFLPHYKAEISVFPYSAAYRP